MSHSRNKNKNKNKKKKNLIIVEQERQKAELKTQLEEIDKTYCKHYASFYQLKKEKVFEATNPLMPEDHPIKVLAQNLRALRLSINNIVEKNEIKDNDALLLYIKIQILCGRFTLNPEARYKYYVKAALCLNQNIAILKDGSDHIFFTQVHGMFSAFNPNFVPEPILMEMGTQLFGEIMDGFSGFMKKWEAESDFIKLSTIYSKLEDLYAAGYGEGISKKTLAAGTKNIRDDFLTQAAKVKRSLEKIKADNMFSIEFQVTYITLNYYMINICDLTHPRSALIIRKIDGQIQNFFTKVKFQSTKDYFNLWWTFKNEYIEDSLALIQNIEVEELRLDESLFIAYIDGLDFWHYFFLRAIGIFLYLAESWIEELKSLKTVSDQFQKELQEYVFKLGTEEMFLLSSISRITSAAKKIKHHLNQKCVDETMAEAAELNVKISELKSSAKKLEEEKLRVAKVVEAELIREETQKKNEIAKKKEETARKRKLRHLQSFKEVFLDGNEYKPEMYEDEDEKAFIEVMSSNPELQHLEEIDSNAMNLSESLGLKSQTMITFIKSRLDRPVQLESRCHNIMFYNIKNILLEYHELISLFGKHKTLSQSFSIPCKEQLSRGIHFSQDVLNQRCKKIYQNIQLLLELINAIIAKQKSSLRDYIYKLGRENTAPDASYTEIINIGEQKFREIGEEKRVKQQEFSEYTKQKNFLQAMKLNFSGFEYLQERIHPYIYDETLCEQGLFSQKDPVGKRAGISEGVFESLLGFIFKQQYDNQPDIVFLKKSLFHLKQAHAVLKDDDECEPEDVQHICELIEVVESKLNQSEHKKLGL